MENMLDTGKPRVVVVSSCESLLGYMVEGLVADERDWMILRVSDNQDLAYLFQKVEELNPTILVFPRHEHDGDERFSIHLMQVCPELKKVILVSLSENLMEVYCKQKIQVKSVQDLFSQVENQVSICEER